MSGEDPNEAKGTAPTTRPRRVGSVGRLSRLGTALQLTLTVFLAVAAVVLLNWLVGRPGIRQRFDLTSTAKNTLATATLGLLERMEDEVLIEVLWRPEGGRRAELDAEVMYRTEKLLGMIATESGGQVDVKRVDTTDLIGWQQRQRELRLQGFENGLIVSRGERREFLPLDGALAQFQPFRMEGDRPVNPRIVSFNAEESIAEAILDVTRRQELHAYFTTGYGENDPFDVDGSEGLGLLVEELKQDGIVAHKWNMAEDGPLPEDCEVLVAIGPRSPWPEDMYAAIVQYAERGGRLVLAPPVDPLLLRASDMPDLFTHFGLDVSEGRVVHPYVDAQTGRVLQGVQQCEIHQLPPSLLTTHPILKPYVSAGRGLVVSFSHQVRIVQQPRAGVAQHLLQSQPQSWLDSVPVDMVFDAEVDGSFGRFPLAATVQMPPGEDAPSVSGLDAELETRIVALGSEMSLTNLDRQLNRDAGFARALFSWVTDQEHRIVVPPRDPDLRFLPRSADNDAFVTASRVAVFYLPGVTFLLGLIVWILRSRGSGRRRIGSSEAAPSKS
ncbi:ABC-type uncharacterized transport system [Planctomycetes bacterium Poly30]|uniref:ABC-type uncharacterized transport system n=1 Tax=Saltatorellus ferox TaxID=2528018 RepID=A0A518ETR4_9BACT|nr:ABC-type uncharacterized transport system [Planctomycetes bacterium Poly30]